MNKVMAVEEVKQKIKRLISEISEIPEEDIRDDAEFGRDIDVDSMMALEIVAKIEKDCKITIPEDEIPSMRSMNAIYSLLERLLEQQAGTRR